MITLETLLQRKGIQWQKMMQKNKRITKRRGRKEREGMHPSKVSENGCFRLNVSIRFAYK